MSIYVCVYRFVSRVYEGQHATPMKAQERVQERALVQGRKWVLVRVWEGALVQVQEQGACLVNTQHLKRMRNYHVAMLDANRPLASLLCMHSQRVCMKLSKAAGCMWGSVQSAHTCHRSTRIVSCSDNSVALYM